MSDVRHGYTLTDIDQLARIAVYRASTSGLDYPTRFDTAWSAIVDYLFATDTQPEGVNLVYAGITGIRRLVQTELRHHGVSRAGDGSHWSAFVRYWDQIAQHTASPEARIVDRTALWQIWHRLSRTNQQTLLALAAHGNYAAAAAALGKSAAAFQVAIGRARREFLRLWHEGETPSPVWARDRHGREVTYRSARRTLVNRQGEGPARLVIEHGKAHNYTRGICRCVDCTTAATDEVTRRRRAAGMQPRRVLTQQDREQILALAAAEVPTAQIVKRLGWSRPTVSNVIRAYRQREAA